MEGLSYIKNAILDYNAIIDADLVKYNFTFLDNEIRLNDLKLGFEGSFGMPNDVDYDNGYQVLRKRYRI